MVMRVVCSFSLFFAEVVRAGCCWDACGPSCPWLCIVRARIDLTEGSLQTCNMRCRPPYVPGMNPLLCGVHQSLWLFTLPLLTDWLNAWLRTRLD